MRHNIDRGGRILTLDLGLTTAAEALEEAIVLLEAEPELWTWDWIVDVGAVPGDASVEQISRLARAFCGKVGPATSATTALVSGDRHLRLWAQVMDFQFPKRRHRVVASLDEALRIIALHRQDR